MKRADAAAVRPADVADVSHVFDGTPFNGDGVVTPASTDGDLSLAIADAMACVGSEPDCSGSPGLDQKRLDAFFAEMKDFLSWCDAGAGATTQPLGPATLAAFQAVAAIRRKVDDYFTRCRLAAFDPRGASLFNRSDVDLASLAAKDLSSPRAELSSLPLARAEADRPLPLFAGANPAFGPELAALARDAVAPALGPGRTSLSAEEWASLCARLSPHEAWQAQKKGAAVEKLGIDRVRALLSGDFKVRMEELIARDLSLAPEARAIADVVRMRPLPPRPPHPPAKLHQLRRFLRSLSPGGVPGRHPVPRLAQLRFCA